MNMKTCIYFYVLTAVFENGQTKLTDDSDLNITEIIRKYGYPVETHEIETEDGYLLDVYRIPHGHGSRTKRPNRYPVIVYHGLLGSAENFIFLGPKKSLAYMLADNGYDVWLCNARGTWHSRKHRTLDPEDAEFWKFTWNEIGIYDIPATIDYISNMTNSDKMHYVGHSQGSTSFFVMCSERPEYNKRIKVMVALAPSAILRHFRQPLLKMIAPFYQILESLADELQEYELLPFVSNNKIRSLGKALCAKSRIIPSSICHMIVLFLLRDDEIDTSVIPFAMSTGPGGGSVKQALHYAQIIDTGTFRKYDWGPTENMRRYHSKKPPEYNIKNITAPVALFYGETDVFVTKEDVEILAKLLPNVVEMYKIPSKSWTHLDFIWAKNLDILVNNKIIEVMKKYDNE